MIKLLKNNLGKYKWLGLLAIVFISIQAISELLLPSKMQEIIEKGITPGDVEMIISTGIDMLIISAVISLCAVCASLLISITSSGVASNVRRAIFVKVTNSSNNQIGKFGTASLITRTTNDVSQIQQLVVQSRFLFFTPIMGIGAIIMAVIKAKELSWIIAIVGVFLAITVVIIISFATPLFKLQQLKLDKLNLVLRESLTGVRVIRAFNRTKQDQKVFEDANLDLTQTSLKVARIMAVMMPVVMIIMNFTTILIYWVGSNYINDSIISMGQMVAFIQYVMHVMISLMFFSMILTFIPRATVSAERINGVLDSTNEIVDNGSQDSEKLLSGIEFKNVTFRFQGAEQPVLKNISFKANPGETTAIIGSTGSGKTTLIDLIPRFHDIESGEILIDGQNINDISIKDLRAKIGLVPQSAVLFSGTVAENIKYGKEDATQEEIEQAAKTSMAYDFIMRKPGGFSETISQGGSNLSGGQKQRLSIARALVRKPEVYIFDDSFSALDFKTDAKLRAALKSEITDAVMLIVAQRVSTIMNAEQIIVLSDGEIAGIGKHKDLYEHCEVYKEIVLSQHSEEEIA